LEFGGINLQFYKKYWDKTLEIIKAHKGRIIFINDDPDLPFLWNLLPYEDWSRWTLAVNAANPNKAKTLLKCPNEVRSVDFPMNTGMPFEEFYEGKINKIVYIGRPNGRAKYFKEYLKSKNLEISGKKEEWKSFSCDVIENPQQRLRKIFYQQYKGCLAVYDDKHKNSGWRTGRAYHALYAGIPVLAPSGNKGLSWCFEIKNSEDIDKFINKNQIERKKIWETQKNFIEKQKKIDILKL
jgi:hypothetical protein